MSDGKHKIEPETRRLASFCIVLFFFCFFFFIYFAIKVDLN